MALIKKKKTNYGIEASYWRLDVATISPKSKEANFTVGLYFDKDADMAVDSYLMCDLMGSTKDEELYNKYFGEDKGRTYKDWQTACYEYLKDNIDFFKDAVDDPEEMRPIEEPK